MTELDEFRILVAQASRKTLKGPEDEALIAAGRFIEQTLRETYISSEHWPRIFINIGNRLDK